jgi:hypothetical protein
VATEGAVTPATEDEEEKRMGPAAAEA